MLYDFTDVVMGISCHPTENVIASGSLEKDLSIRLWRHVDEANNV